MFDFYNKFLIGYYNNFVKRFDYLYLFYLFTAVGSKIANNRLFIWFLLGKAIQKFVFYIYLFIYFLDAFTYSLCSVSNSHRCSKAFNKIDQRF